MSEDRLADLAAAIPNEGEEDADPTRGEQLNSSHSPLPEQMSPIHMEGIPEAREEGERLSRNTSPCLDINTQQQMQNDSYNTVVSNDRISPSLVRDNVMYNKQNEYAV